MYFEHFIYPSSFSYCTEQNNFLQLIQRININLSFISLIRHYIHNTPVATPLVILVVELSIPDFSTEISMYAKVKKTKLFFLLLFFHSKKRRRKKNSGKTDVSFYLAFVCLQLAMCAYDITYFWMFFFSGLWLRLIAKIQTDTTERW